jgi:hypothetical protein
MQNRGLSPEGRVYSHGQGYDMVERPLIRSDETMELAANMCFAIHPSYETTSVFAVICDNYIIGTDGPNECLHKTEKKYSSPAKIIDSTVFVLISRISPALSCTNVAAASGRAKRQ